MRTSVEDGGAEREEVAVSVLVVVAIDDALGDVFFFHIDN